MRYQPRLARWPSPWKAPDVEAMVSPDGYRVEQVTVQKSLSRPPRTMLRVRKGTYLIRDCASVAEVAQLVDLARLMPEQRAADTPTSRAPVVIAPRNRPRVAPRTPDGPRGLPCPARPVTRYLVGV
jgi:hypothetical protein